MFDYLSFEIQVEIMKRLPVKLLIQSRSVCKAWKSLIDSADFIKHYRGQQQHILVSYQDSVNYQKKYVLIADDHTFPHQKVSLTVPLSLKMLVNPWIVGCSHGLLCLYGEYKEGRDGPLSGTGKAVVLWNPFIRKDVVVDVPNVADWRIYDTIFGFGVCRETLDPKIVKITNISTRGCSKGVSCIPWQVEVFTLSTRAWRPPYSSNLPRNSIEFDYLHKVVINGVFYWLAKERITVDGGFNYYSLIIAFDMTSEEFSKVKLPDNLARKSMLNLSICKLMGSLVVLEFDVEANEVVFRVWMMEDVIPKSFTKLLTTINTPYDEFQDYVMGFRKTGEPILQIAPRYPEWIGSIALYVPDSKSISSLGIKSRYFSYVGLSYIETLFLL